MNSVWVLIISAHCPLPSPSASVLFSGLIIGLVAAKLPLKCLPFVIINPMIITLHDCHVDRTQISQGLFLVN